MESKTVIIALAVIGTLTAGFLLFGGSKPQPDSLPVTPDALKDMYNQWKVEYNVHVGAAEDDQRFKIFSSNVEKINEVNAQGKSYKLGLNAFTHLTQEEFSATHLGLKTVSGPRNTVRLPLRNLKANVDWSAKMNAPKDQGQCGSCWAFSAVGAIEGAYAVAGQKLNLAEQELVDCGSEFGNNGCNGGLMDYAFQYAIKYGGLATEDSYPYTAVDGTCARDGKTRAGKISSFTDVKVNSSDALKAAIARQPVSVAIEADTFAFQSYTSGVITGDACGIQLDHGVVAVGYNDEDSTPYYKVRNSWGPKWGDAGHVRIGITDGPGVCGIQQAASYPTI